MRKVIFTVSIVLMQACSNPPEDHQLTEAYSIRAIEESKMPKTDQAEALAQAAEALLTADGFPEAHEIALKALVVDSANVRAGYVKVVSGLALGFRGMLTRMTPLMLQHPEARKSLVQINESSQEKSSEAYNRYLRAEAPGIHDEEEFLRYLDTLSSLFLELKHFAQNSKNEELVVRGNAILFPDLNRRYARSCTIERDDKDEYQVTCPASRFRRELILNRADFEVISELMDLYVIYFRLMTAYDLSGSIALSADHQGERAILNHEAYQKLVQNSQFGRLRPENQLQSVSGHGLGFVSSFEYLMENFKTLCPMGNVSPRNRPGHLFVDDLCLHPSYSTYTNLFKQAFKGELMVEKATREGGPASARVNYMAIFNKPIKDVRGLGPFEFDRCGNLVRMSDPTFGGGFPDGDVNGFLPYIQDACKP